MSFMVSPSFSHNFPRPPTMSPWPVSAPRQKTLSTGAWRRSWRMPWHPPTALPWQRAGLGGGWGWGWSWIWGWVIWHMICQAPGWFTTTWRDTHDVAHSSACCDRWQMYTTRFHRCSQLDHHKGLWCPELSSSWMHLAITILWMTWIFTQHPVSLRNLKPPYPRSTWLGFC